MKGHNFISLERVGLLGKDGEKDLAELLLHERGGAELDAVQGGLGLPEERGLVPLVAHVELHKAVGPLVGRGAVPEGRDLAAPPSE